MRSTDLAYSMATGRYFANSKIYNDANGMSACQKRSMRHPPISASEEAGCQFAVQKGLRRVVFMTNLSSGCTGTQSQRPLQVQEATFATFNLALPARLIAGLLFEAPAAILALRFLPWQFISPLKFQ